MLEIGNTLRQLRLEKGLTQEDVANSVGVSRTSYNLWEADLRSPKKINIIQLSKFFDVDPNYLLGFGAARKPGLKLVSIPIYLNGNTTNHSIAFPAEMLPNDDNYIACAKSLNGNIQIMCLKDKRVLMTINRY